MDLQVAARALSFMEAPMSGRVRVGIVYSPQSPGSVSQARQIASQLAGGMRIGNMDLEPSMVPLTDAGSAEVDLFLLTEHVPAAGTLAEVSKARRIPCVTKDLDKVEAGDCIMAVRSRPKVEIIVNRDAANLSGLRFATAFRVMVTEL